MGVSVGPSGQRLLRRSSEVRTRSRSSFASDRSMTSASERAELTPAREDGEGESAGERPLAFDAKPIVFLESVDRLPTISHGGQAGSWGAQRRLANAHADL